MEYKIRKRETLGISKHLLCSPHSCVFGLIQLRTLQTHSVGIEYLSIIYISSLKSLTHHNQTKREGPYSSSRWLKRVRGQASMWLWICYSDNNGSIFRKGEAGCWGTKEAAENTTYSLVWFLVPHFSFLLCFSLVHLSPLALSFHLPFSPFFLISFSLSTPPPPASEDVQRIYQTHSLSFWTNTCSYYLPHLLSSLHGPFPWQGTPTPALSPGVADESLGKAQHVKKQEQKRENHCSSVRRLPLPLPGSAAQPTEGESRPSLRTRQQPSSHPGECYSPCWHAPGPGQWE